MKGFGLVPFDAMGSGTAVNYHKANCTLYCLTDTAVFLSDDLPLSEP